MNANDARVELPEATVAERVVSVGLWAAGLSWLVPMMGTMTALSAVVHPKKTEWLSRIYTRGQIALTGSAYRTVVDPAVDASASYLFVQNHTNHFDHVFLYNATPHFKQGLELESHFKYPVYGYFMKKRGTIPVRPGSSGQTPAIMENMRNEIAAGHSILAFPEGTRTTTGRVGKFRSGVFFIARELGIPVVPVTVTGAYELMHKGSYVLRPGHTITVHVDAPHPTAGKSDDEIRALTNQVRDHVAARVDRYWNERGYPTQAGES